VEGKARVLPFAVQDRLEVKSSGGGEPRRHDHGQGLGDGGLRQRAAVLASVIVLIALVVGSFFGDRGFLNLVAERARTQDLAREVDGLRAENEQLNTEIHALRSDPRAIERIAREELGLARPDELVFVLRSPAPPAARP
jgi:cell division protein FtsB